MDLVVALPVIALVLVVFGMFRYLTATGVDRELVRRRRRNAGRLINWSSIGLCVSVFLLAGASVLVAMAR